jgi:hypothetical protein
MKAPGFLHCVKIFAISFHPQQLFLIPVYEINQYKIRQLDRFYHSSHMA